MPTIKPPAMETAIKYGELSMPTRLDLLDRMAEDCIGRRYLGRANRSAFTCPPKNWLCDI